MSGKPKNTGTLPQADIEINIESHIMFYNIVKLFKNQFLFLTFCVSINLVFYVNIGEIKCSEHD